MRLLLNVIWFVLCGFWMAIAWTLMGILYCVLLVTIPFGLASFRIAAYALWPFGRSVVRRPGSGAMSLIGNLLWIVFGGWTLALGHLLTGILLCVTVVGIPLGLGSFKLIAVSLAPLGAEIVPTDRLGGRAPLAGLG